MKNGNSPTAITVDDVTVDINRVGRVEFNEFWKAVNAETDEAKQNEITGELVAKVVTRWPFDVAISKESYVKLGVLDMQQVDNALLEAVALIFKKKSQLSLTPPANSSGPSAPS